MASFSLPGQVLLLKFFKRKDLSSKFPIFSFSEAYLIFFYQHFLEFRFEEEIEDQEKLYTHLFSFLEFLVQFRSKLHIETYLLRRELTKESHEIVHH